jgi:heptosyltransferase-1
VNKVLLVKLSSLGDVVHTMPAAMDVRAAFPQAQLDWVVERGFAPLVRSCSAVNRVIECELRRWRQSPLAGHTRRSWRDFKAELQREPYDTVIDLQGLTKSAVIARLARCAPEGKRYALANRTEGSSYEPPTRWLADVAIHVEPHVHAVRRSRILCAQALGYELPAAVHYGLTALPSLAAKTIAFVHGTSRDDKCWPVDHWHALGERLIAAGYDIALPHGSDAERERSERLAGALGVRAAVWPRLDLAALTQRLGACAGVIGVDSGLSHIAVALDLPHVQIYNFDTAWRTGPTAESTDAAESARQVSVFARPTPSVDAVWQAWRGVSAT